MDFDTFDTDFWSEIQDAPGEIFDIEEGMEDEQTWNQFVNSNVTVWQVAHGGGLQDSPNHVILHSYLRHPMPDTLSRNIYRDLFSDDQWDLIYAMSGHALDNDDFTPEDVYSIRNKIHALFDYNDWYLFFCWWWCDSSRTGRCHLHRHHTGAMLHSLLQFSPS